MLKLIKCEFLKLKRKKFIPLIILAAFLFPIPLTYLMTTPSMMERYTDQADAFDGLFNLSLIHIFETVDRLIQNQKLRIVHNGKGDGKPLLHTKRIL